MSAKTIALFEAHRRESTTLPPVPDDDPIAELERRLRHQLHKASRAFAKAQELEAQIALLKGNHT